MMCKILYALLETSVLVAIMPAFTAVHASAAEIT
jgi:hypothetical protein